MSSQTEQSVGLTKKQNLVMNLLRKTKGPLSTYSILNVLHGSGFRRPVKFIVEWNN